MEIGPVGSLLSGVAQCGAALGALYYFGFKLKRGYHAPNLSVAVQCSRSISGEPSKDWLSILVTLKKADRGALELLDASARVTGAPAPLLVPLWGCHLARKERVGKASIDWTAESGPSMNLTPGEETQFAAHLQVPSAIAYRVDVAILAAQHGDKISGKEKVGQWQASAVSLPASAAFTTSSEMLHEHPSP